MNDRDVAWALAAARASFGVAFLSAPALTTRRWLGPPSSVEPVKVFTRAIGARDLALGLGLLVALESGAPARPWLRAGAAVDALDTVATLAAFRHLPRVLRFAVLALGVGGAVTGVRLAAALD